MYSDKTIVLGKLGTKSELNVALEFQLSVSLLFKEAFRVREKRMARCDEGYLCKICNEEVEHITDSSLYLRYVIGEIDPELLHLEPDKHLTCIATLSQFIDDERLGVVECNDPMFSKSLLDPDFVASRTKLLTTGYRRLWEIREQRRKPLTVVEYPLPEFAHRWREG